MTTFSSTTRTPAAAIDPLPACMRVLIDGSGPINQHPVRAQKLVPSFPDRFGSATGSDGASGGHGHCHAHSPDPFSTAKKLQETTHHNARKSNEARLKRLRSCPAGRWRCIYEIRRVPTHESLSPSPHGHTNATAMPRPRRLVYDATSKVLPSTLRDQGEQTSMTRRRNQSCDQATETNRTAIGQSISNDGEGSGRSIGYSRQVAGG